MAKSTKRNKKYRPKYVPGQIPVSIRFTDDDARRLKLVPYLELNAILDRTPEEAPWHVVALRLNVGYSLASTCFTHVEELAMGDALIAHLEVWKRFLRVKRMGLTDQEYDRIHAGLVLVDEMQDQTTRREHAAAIKYALDTSAH